MAFSIRSQTIHLVFDSKEGIISAIRESVKAERDEHLNINYPASMGDRLVFQSITGSTRAEITDDRAVLQTKFFGDFTDAGQCDARRDYSRAKVGRLIEILRRQTTISFIGINIDARWSLSEMGLPREAVVKAVRDEFLSGTSLTEGENPYDFTLRVSRVVPPDMFSNISLGWYIERSILIPVDLAQVGVVAFREWNLPVSDEGLEFKYDRNNKFGLMQGKADHDLESLLAVVMSAHESLPNAIGNISEPLGRRLEAIQ